jgi:hypothetical protein
VPSPARRPFVRLDGPLDLLLRGCFSGATATIDSFARGMDRPADRVRHVSPAWKELFSSEAQILLARV